MGEIVPGETGKRQSTPQGPQACTGNITSDISPLRFDVSILYQCPYVFTVVVEAISYVNIELPRYQQASFVVMEGTKGH